MDAEHVDEFGSRETRDDTTVINVQGDLHPLGKYYNGIIWSLNIIAMMLCGYISEYNQ
jgi:hypothetical protein